MDVIIIMKSVFYGAKIRKNDKFSELSTQKYIQDTRPEAPTIHKISNTYETFNIGK